MSWREWSALLLTVQKMVDRNDYVRYVSVRVLDGDNSICRVPFVARSVFQNNCDFAFGVFATACAEVAVAALARRNHCVCFVSLSTRQGERIQTSTLCGHGNVIFAIIVVTLGLTAGFHPPVVAPASSGSYSVLAAT